MIQIFQNKNLNEHKMKEIEEWYKDVIMEIIKKMKENKKKEKKEKDIKKKLEQIEKDLKESFECDTLKDLLVIKYNDLVKLKKKMKGQKISNKQIYNPGSKTNGKLNTKKLILVKIYENFRTNYGGELCEKLEISVCPYCNRNFINSYNGGDEKLKTSAQFDHFFNKTKYPIFAVCLYNLIPCCYDCNHTKSTKEFKISPYDNSCTSDELVTFSYQSISLNKIEIEIKKAENTDKNKVDKAKRKECDNNIIKLQEKYQIHNHYVKEIIEKTKIYPKTYFSSSICKNLGMTNEELFLGIYLSEENYYKRPLSKLTHDINKEIKSTLKSNGK